MLVMQCGAAATTALLLPCLCTSKITFFSDMLSYLGHRGGLSRMSMKHSEEARAKMSKAKIGTNSRMARNIPRSPTCQTEQGEEGQEALYQDPCQNQRDTEGQAKLKEMCQYQLGFLKLI